MESVFLRAARQIYLSHYAIRPYVVKQPSGVVVNRSTYQGKLLFSSKPILLPEECFVPLSQIELAQRKQPEPPPEPPPWAGLPT